GDLRKKTFKNPYGISFTPSLDILDRKSVLSKIKGFKIDDQRRIYDFIKNELATEIDFVKLESNLASVINILSKEDWNQSETMSELNSFEIERKISYSNLSSAKILINDYSIHYSRVDKIYAEFDSQGSNKSNSVLAAIRQEYIKAKSSL